uniref:Uncharacterized protein n=1 Tax=Anguilla anguilla TaxID=7936 RepID=A0A0E9WIJ2_ANGAN
MFIQERQQKSISSVMRHVKHFIEITTSQSKEFKVSRDGLS